MRITAEMVDDISQLSRLSLLQAEKERMTGGVEPMSHVFSVKNVLREDREAPSWDRGELLKNAPASDGETFLVPRAVECGGTRDG